MEYTEQKTKKKKSLLGKLLIILGSIVVLILLILLIIPIFFKGKLVEMTKSEINKNLNATVDFDGSRLTFFRSFPSLTLDLKNLSVINKEPFMGDTLFYSDAISLTLNVMSLFRDEPFEIKRLDLYRPVAILKINTEGNVNWDVALSATEDDAVPEQNDGDPFVMNLRSIRIHDGKLAYLDRELDMDIYAYGLNGSVSGRFSESQAMLTTELNADSFDFVYEQFAWLKNIKLTYHALIEADFENSIYVLKKNSLLLNELALTADGSFGLTDDDIIILLSFETMKSDFKSLLSLIPAVYARDFDNLQTSGQFTLIGSVKGNYSENSMPGFNLDLVVDEGAFNYPELPSKIEKLNLKLRVDNKTGVPDATLIDLSQFDFEMDKNPFKAKFLLKTPISNPDFDASMNGKLNFEKLTQAFPLDEGEQLAGDLQFDISIKSNMKDIENSRFDKIRAMGSIVANDINYQSASIGMPVFISNAQLNFAPAYLDLVGMTIAIGESDMNLSGRFQDYLSYYLSDGILSGNLEMKSRMLDANALMTALNPETEGAVEDTTASSLELPTEIDFRFKADIDTLLYEQFELTNAKADLHYKDQRLNFVPLSAEMLGGTINLQGYFDAVDKVNPIIDIEFGISEFDIPIAYQKIGLMQKLAPVAEKATGDFSTGLKLKARLDGNLKPVFESISGGGTLQTSQLEIQASDVLIRLADMIGNDDYKRLLTDGLNFSYEFVNGRMFQKPVNLQYAGTDVAIGGSVGFDQTIDYEMIFQIPFGKVGQSLAGQINNLVNQGGTLRIALDPDTRINVVAHLSGMVTDPKIELDYSNFASNLRSSLEEQVLQALQQQKEEVTERVREEAERIMQQARNQAAEIMQLAETTASNIRSEATRAADQIRNEAETQAKLIEQEGIDRGMVAEMAAKETARMVRNEGNSTAQNLIDEAEKRANDVIRQAQNQSDNIINSAQQQIDRL